jgi:hypothetical protein
MIKLTVYLWTDTLAPRDDQVIPGHAWGYGTVAIKANPTHGIKAGPERQLPTLDDLPAVVRGVLDDAGVTIHTPPAP